MKIVISGITALFLLAACGGKQPDIVKELQKDVVTNDNYLKDENSYVLNENESKVNLVHIVRHGDGTVIEMWINPYDDDIEVDYTFSKQDNIAKSIEEESQSEHTSHSEDENLLDEEVTKNQEPSKELSGSDSSEAIQTTPADLKDFLNLYEKSQQLFFDKQFEAALRQIDEAILLVPDAIQAYKLKGSIQYRLKDIEGAKASWKKALELDPSAKDVETSLNELESNKQ